MRASYEIVRHGVPDLLLPPCNESHSPVSLANSRLLSLNYGAAGKFSCEIDASRVLASFDPPPPNADFRAETRRALESPVDFPPLEQALIPDDHVAIALDRHVPEAPTLIAEVWRIFQRRGITAGNVTIVQPGDPAANGASPDPRAELPPAVRNDIHWVLHDPHAKDACAYLASTASGQRIYLARAVVDADVAITVGQIGYDALIGYRGTNSVFYPGLSNGEAIRRARGQGHSELSPGDSRPLRQLMDEVGWLLGTQFSLQVVPSAAGGICNVVGGAVDSVLRRGEHLMDEHWLVQLDRRPEIVVAAVDRDAAGHGWEQIAAALETARRLVARGGRILILSELEAEPGEGMELLGRQQSPQEAIKPLKSSDAPDAQQALRLAYAADWAEVFLVSRLETSVVEGLFLVPVENQREAHKVLAGEGSCVFLRAAQRAFGRIGA